MCGGGRRRASPWRPRAARSTWALTSSLGVALSAAAAPSVPSGCWELGRSWPSCCDPIHGKEGNLTCWGRMFTFDCCCGPLGKSSEAAAITCSAVDFKSTRRPSNTPAAHDNDTELFSLTLDALVLAHGRWAGVILDPKLMLNFASKVVQPFRHEWCRLPMRRDHVRDWTQFARRNYLFEGLDPILLHSVIRAFKPKLILELGSGHSTRVTAAALRQNKQDCGTMGDLQAIDPQPKFPSKFRGLYSMRLSRFEYEAIDLYTSLGENDILFVDSSHIVGGVWYDVAVVFGELLPRLRPGVLVHVHDIFLSSNVYFLERNYTEQFVLHAFLQNNPYFDILWFEGVPPPWKQSDEDMRTYEELADTLGSAYFQGKWHALDKGASVWLRRNDLPLPPDAAGVAAEDEAPTRTAAAAAAGIADRPRRRVADLFLARPRRWVGWRPPGRAAAAMGLAGLRGLLEIAAAAAARTGARRALWMREPRLPETEPPETLGRAAVKVLTLQSTLREALALSSGDLFVVPDCSWMSAHHRGTIAAVTEVAPRLRRGVLLVFGACPSVAPSSENGELIVPERIDGIAPNEMETLAVHRGGQFLVQAFGTFNDAWEVLRGPGASKGDDVMVLRRL
mmetsp:Transcript_163899/g.520985  ORF Transcript_163899/g.520985 Transcript_163899/m.520985 type:complete len:621 (+) Transcript_163899:105-1967(+)